MSDEQQQPTSAEETARIAKLTSGAIRASGDKLIADVTKAIEAAEQSASLLRLEADNLIEELRKHTNAFADKVTSYVENCHNATLMFRDYQGRLGDMPNGVQNFHTLDQQLTVERAIGEGKLPLTEILKS